MNKDLPKLQSGALNLGHTALIPVFLSSNVVWNGFFVELSKFEANIEKDREKGVEQNMSTLFLQLTQVLMSRIVATIYDKTVEPKIIFTRKK